MALAMLATMHLAGHAQESNATRSVQAVYQADVRPLLQKYCFECHGATKPKGDIRLDTLSIDPELPDLVAVAFSRDSRQLACLASTGAIEIVPVP